MLHTQFSAITCIIMESMVSHTVDDYDKAAKLVDVQSVIDSAHIFQVSNYEVNINNPTYITK